MSRGSQPGGAGADMQSAFRTRAEAGCGEFAYVASLQHFDLSGRVDLHLILAATTRVARDFSAPLPTRPPRETCPDLLKANCVRPSLTAEVNASVHTVAHRNGTPPASGTQSQGLRERRTPGYRIGPPEGFRSRPEPVRKEVCHAGSIPART